MPIYGNQPMGAIPQPMPNTGNYVNYMPQQNTNGGWANTQPTIPMNQSHVMSIAPAGPRENAQQFPVAVNTDLYLINMNEMKLYFKNNPSNPSEMREFDLVEVIKQDPKPDVVSRAEFDELKSMMSQMMNFMQGNQNQQQRPPKNTYNGGKRGNRNDRSDGNAANNE